MLKRYKKFSTVLLSITLLFTLVCCNMPKALTENEILNKIDNIFCEWSENIIDIEVAKVSMVDCINEKYESTQIKVDQYIAFMDVEHNGYLKFKQAEDLFYQYEYAKAMSILSDLNDTFTQKEAGNKLYNDCKQIILLQVSSPSSYVDYEKHIDYLTTCLSIIDDKDLKERKNLLHDELMYVVSVDKIINNAESLYNAGMIKSAFEVLANGLREYPNDERLLECAQGFYDFYVTETFKEAKELKSAKEYKEAIKLLETASENVDCAEFDLAIEMLKEEKSPLYKFGKDTINLFNNAKDYIIRSGEKLILGDYSDKDITVLSLGANVAVSLSGLDFMFDLRDIVYDVQHWGEGEYFLLFMAADVVAIIPIIGAIKNFKKTDEVVDTVKEITNAIDVMADNVKTVDDIVDVIDETTDLLKNVNTIEDVVDNVTNITKNTEKINESIDELVTGYTRHVITKNQSLVNDVHPITGVFFRLKEVVYKYVDDVVGVFPKFDTIFEYKLSEDLWKATDAKQFKKCNEALYEEILNNKTLREMFNEDQLKALGEGKTPEGWTWHHNEEEGLMQLVDAEKHKYTAHDGGRKFWGGGDACRNKNCLLEEDKK